MRLLAIAFAHPAEQRSVFRLHVANLDPVFYFQLLIGDFNFNWDVPPVPQAGRYWTDRFSTRVTAVINCLTTHGSDEKRVR